METGDGWKRQLSNHENWNSPCRAVNNGPKYMVSNLQRDIVIQNKCNTVNKAHDLKLKIMVSK